MQESIDATRMGVNRTGMQMSPEHGQEMLEGLSDLDAAVAADMPDGQELSATRLEYIAEADPIGSVPAPGTLKGVAKSGAKMLTGHRPQAFIDKLAERLAFERGGTRLYDAVLVKVQAYSDELADELDRITVAGVTEIRDAEARHALLIKECLEQLGADPTAQTPSADLVGVETMGLLQAASDPRTSLAQTLHAALAAELIDVAGWENLIGMAQKMGQEDMVERFRAALDQEETHLATVRHWYNALTIETARLI